MKRKITITILTLVAAAILLTATPAALAADGLAPEDECQPGADNQIIEGWQLLSLEEYAKLLVEEGSASDYESALERATATYAFCDRNGDNYACVMEQNLPNDASGSSLWFLIEDNHPFGGQ
jgi:hypothetical protein